MIKTIFAVRRSVVTVWAMYYILIIIIPVIITGIMYFHTKNVIDDEVMHSNEVVLTKYRQNMDTILGDIKKLSLEIASRPKVLEVLRISKPILDQDYFTIHQSTNEMTNIRIFNSFVKDFYIYFKNIDTIIAPGSVFDKQSFYQTYVEPGGKSYEDWINMLESVHDGDYIHTSHAIAGVVEDKDIAVVRSLPIGNKNDFSANLVVILNESRIISNQDSFDNLSSTNMLIIDSNNEIFIGNADDEIINQLKNTEMSGSAGHTFIKSGSNNLILSYISSSINEWKYVFITPESQFWRNSKNVRLIMLAALFSSLVIGGGLAVFFLKKSYNPIKNIVNMLESNLNTKYIPVNNEYGFMRQAISNTLDQKKQIELKLSEQNNLLRRSFISSLLRGKKMREPLEGLLATYNITFKTEYFIVLAFYVDSIDERMWNDKTGKSDSYDLVRFVVTNVVEEVVNKNMTGYMTEVEDMLFCLVNMSGTPDNWKQEINMLVEELREYIERKFGIYLNISCSNQQTGVSQIPAAFEEALQVMENVRMLGDETISFYDDVSKKNEQDYFYPVEYEYKLINCIKARDFDAACEILEEVFEKNLNRELLSPDIIRCFMFDIVSTIIKVIKETGTDQSSYIDEKTIEELLKCRNLKQTKANILAVVEKICSDTSSNDKKQDYHIRDKVFEYIKEYYQDPNFGIASISEYLNMTPYYISRIFKEQSGESITDCINSFRIQKAKEIMKESHLSQEEIAYMVGYSNVRTFHRSFKKHEGVSPGKLKG